MSSEQRDSTAQTGLAALVIVPAVIWGASFLFIAEGLEIVAPMGVAFIRIALGFAALACFPSARRPIAARDWPATIALGVTWFAFPLPMFPIAEQHVTSALAGILNGAVPMTTALVATAVARKLPGRATGVALAVGLAGIVLAAAPSLGHGGNQLTSVLAILAALVSYGFALNLAGPLQRRNGALPVIWRALAVSVVLTAPLGAPTLVDMEWELGPLLCLLALGVLGTGVANVLSATAAGRVSPTVASSTTFIIPVVSYALGVTLRGEHVESLAVLGGVICLVGAWLLTRSRARPPVVATEAAPV